MIEMPPRNKVLDLRYNEMWNDWNGMDDHLIPKQSHSQLVLSWKKLNVSVKQVNRQLFKPSVTTYKQILYNVSGHVQCGTLLGIMGSSGSGKTTLMATISHRTKSNFEGDLLVNGRPISEEAMIKMSGFVPQHDIGFNQLTALEHLVMMANLKMDRNTSATALKEHIDYIVSLLGMSRFLNTRVLNLSGGERKKVALAVQMLNDPPILFCDEITTGLDSYSAAHVVNTLKNVARTGKIVICTIHQPASGVFGKFDEVVLLTSGKLAYHGPVSMVHQLFQKFNYACPAMFNEADFIIAILNSENDSVKKSVDEMCKISSAEVETDFFNDSFNNQKQLNHMQYLQTLKPRWKTQFKWVLDRSVKCFIRDYQTNLLKLGFGMILSVILSAPFANLQFDTKAVQNWEGFWFSFITSFVFNNSYSGLSMYEQFSVVHREIHNEVYSLTAYHASELSISLVWIILRMMSLCIPAFLIVGVKWGTYEVLTFFLLAFVAHSYGSMLSACCSRIETKMAISTVYDNVALSVNGAYVTFRSLPKVLYYLRHFSIFFLGNELASVLFWSKVKYLPCIDVDNCLHNGEEVLNKYSFVSDEFNLDISILLSFGILAQILIYFGIFKRMKKQPAY